MKNVKIRNAKFICFSSIRHDDGLRKIFAPNFPRNYDEERRDGEVCQKQLKSLILHIAVMRDSLLSLLYASMPAE